MKLRLNIADFLTILLLMLCINVTYSVFCIPYYDWLPLLTDIVLILFYVIRSQRVPVKKLYLTMINQFFLPLIIPSILAAITSAVVYRDNEYTMSSFRIILLVYGAYLLGYFLVQKYGVHAIHLLAVAGSVSYTTVIFQFYVLKMPNVSLEVHELTYIYGILFTFYLLYKNLDSRFRYRMLALCVMGMILGNKRALWLAVVIALCVYFFFSRISLNKYRTLAIVSFVCIIVVFGWIWLVKSGIFELLCNRFGINDMSRLVMWDAFREDYAFSPTYLGRGLNYTDVVMTKIHRKIGITVAIPIHNAMLSMYIGWGFLPFLYYISVFCYLRPNSLAKINVHNAWVFMTCSIIILIINFFGGTMFNMGISILYGMLWSLFRTQNNKDCTRSIIYETDCWNTKHAKSH